MAAGHDKEFMSTDLKCKVPGCNKPLKMYDYGDWGWCGTDGHPIYNLFQKEMEKDGGAKRK